MKFYRPDTFNTVNKQSENAIDGTKYQGIIKQKYTVVFLTDNDM